MGRLRLALLGGFEARLDAGGPVTLARHKVEALLAFLALRPGQLHRRDKLAALLWADAPSARARHSLRQALAELRLALAPAPACLVERRDTVALDPEAMDVDVLRFEALVADGGAPSLEQAVALYRGDLLEGLRVGEPPFEDWLMGERERLRETAVEALARLLAGHLAAGATGPAVQAALRLLAIDPLQESVHRTLMRLYLRLGRRGAGLRQYQACLEVLRRELGAAPEPETRTLYVELLQASGAAEPGEATGAAPPAAAATADGVPAPPLVGRDADLARLGEAYERARRGDRPVIVLVGETGIGKTRLVAELVATLAASDVRVLAGRAHETESDLPLGLWVRLLRDSGVLADAAGRIARRELLRRELARLFPELAEPDAAASVSADRGPLFEAVAQVIGGLDAPGVLLVLEDVHWADEPSLRLLAFLLRRLPRGALAVVLSAREEELVEARPLRQALGELDREGLGRAMHLGPLSREATAALVRSLARTADGPDALERLSQDLWQVSEGNPFMVVETMRALQEGGSAEAAAGLRLPQRVHDTICGRLDRLSDRARRLAGVAAAIGRPFDFALLHASAGADVGEAAEAVEQLVARRILHVIGERLGFTHDWIRQTAYERVVPPVRPAVHAAIARALEGRHAGRLDEVIDELAYHYGRGDAPAKAVAFLSRFAGVASTRYALEEAVRALHQALEHAGRLPSPARDRARVELMLQLAFVLSVVGRFPEILERLEPLGDAVAALGDPAVRARFLTRIALTRSVLGQHAAAEATARQALVEADAGGDDGTRGTARYVLAVKGFVNGQPRDGLAHARQAAALLARAGDPAWLAQAWWIHGWNLYLLGKLDAALEAESRMEALAERLGDRGRQSTAAWSSAVFHATRADIERAEEAAARARSLAPDAANRVTAEAVLAMVAAQAGDPLAAIPVLEHSVRELDAFRLRQATILLFLADAHRRAGRLADARDVAARTRAMSAQMAFAWAVATAERSLGRIALAHGEPDEAARHLDAALGMFAAMPAGFELGRTHLELARLAGDAGDAAAHLRAAHGFFAAAPAPRYVERTRDLAVEIGVGAVV